MNAKKDFTITRRNGTRTTYQGHGLGIIAVMAMQSRPQTITATRRSELTACGLKIAEPVASDIIGAPVI